MDHTLRFWFYRLKSQQFRVHVADNYSTKLVHNSAPLHLSCPIVPPWHSILSLYLRSYDLWFMTQLLSISSFIKYYFNPTWFINLAQASRIKSQKVILSKTKKSKSDNPHCSYQNKKQELEIEFLSLISQKIKKSSKNIIENLNIKSIMCLCSVLHVFRDKKLMCLLRNESIYCSKSEIPCVIVKKGNHSYAQNRDGLQIAYFHL